MKPTRFEYVEWVAYAIALGSVLVALISPLFWRLSVGMFFGLVLLAIILVILPSAIGRGLTPHAATLPAGLKTKQICRVCGQPMTLMDEEEQRQYCYKDDEVFMAKEQRWVGEAKPAEVAVEAKRETAQRLGDERGPDISLTRRQETQVTMERAMKFCRYCGANIPRDSIYCEECGTKLSAPQGMESVSALLCRNCGNTLPAWVRFCNRCGSPAS